MVYEWVDDRFVSSEHLDISDIIRDYDPDLELCWIPPEARREDDVNPWAVFHTKDGNRYLVRTFAECDHRILAYLWNNDTTRTDVLSKIDAENAAKEAIRLKAELEASEERQDIISSTLKSPLHTYKMANGSVIRSRGHF